MTKTLADVVFSLTDIFTIVVPLWGIIVPLAVLKSVLDFSRFGLSLILYHVVLELRMFVHHCRFSSSQLIYIHFCDSSIASIKYLSSLTSNCTSWSLFFLSWFNTYLRSGAYHIYHRICSMPESFGPYLCAFVSHILNRIDGLNDTLNPVHFHSAFVEFALIYCVFDCTLHQFELVGDYFLSWILILALLFLQLNKIQQLS